MGANFQKIRFQVTNSSKMEFVDITLWPWESILLFWALHLIAIEIFQNAIVMNIGKLEKKKIEIKGGHLDSLSAKDKAFIVFNRLCIPFLSYFLFRFCWLHPEHVEWDLNKLSPFNTVGSMLSFFLFYDFFYVLFHRILHIRGK